MAIKKTDKIIEPLGASFDEVAGAVARPRATHQQNTSKIKTIARLPMALPTGQKPQSELFHVDKQAELNGIEMGVLESGVPYLSGRGLASMCGLDHTSLLEMANNWSEEKLKPRGRQINQLLEQTGYFESELYLRSEHKGTEISAYTEPVCLAILEYFAFVANPARPKAIQAFRTLARVKFREFVYEAVGYRPEQKVLDSWKHFHDRVDMTQDAAPFGFFGVFREIAVMIVPMIRSGILISDKVVPDISVGRCWSDFWEENNLAAKYGERTRYDHDYPGYYPQAKSNPQHPFAYPNAALGEFRGWLQQNYIANKFPTYLLGQAKKGALTMSAAAKASEAFGIPQIEFKPKRLK